MRGHVAAHVDHVQSPAGTQHAKNLGRGGRFRVPVQMMQHHRRQDPVEFAVGIGQSLRVAVFEANPAQPGCLSLRALQRKRVGIGSDH